MILGINISHHASICLLSDNKIEYYEEDRFNRRKYWQPQLFDYEYLSINEKVNNPDKVIFASFDTRYCHKNDTDKKLVEKISNLYGFNEVVFNANEHHLYHAVSGFHLSNFDDAVVIVMDGGGAQEFPYYQEVESIYNFTKDNYTKKYVHATINRSVRNTKFQLDNKEFNYNNVDYLLSSGLSSGMMFNNFCSQNGFGSGGFNAGKVMGLASYGKVGGDKLEDKAQELQQDTKQMTIELIKKALTYSNSKNIVLSGGYALNCVNNYDYVKHFKDYNFFIDPIAHDGGISMGAALWLRDYANTK